jgi:hypothetical protein
MPNFSLSQYVILFFSNHRIPSTVLEPTPKKKVLYYEPITEEKIDKKNEPGENQ